MSSVNKVILVGNVGKDVDIRRAQSGDPIANFTLATSESWKDKTTGAKQERTEWHCITVFGPLAGIVEKYVTKGMRLYLQGKLVTRKWQDQSGADRWTTEVVLSGYGAELVMLSHRKDGDGGGNDPGSDDHSAAQPSRSYELDDDIPF